MADLTADAILARYREEIYGKFAPRGVKPADPTDEKGLNVLRALESSKGWRTKGQEELRRINSLVDKLIGIRDDKSKLTQISPSEDKPENKPEYKPEGKKPSPPTPPQSDPETSRSTIQLNEWPSNVSRYSGTGISYGWDDHYIRAVVDGFNLGARTQRGAHGHATKELMAREIVITEGDANRMNERELSELTEEQKKFFKPMEEGSYSEFPVKNKDAVSNPFGNDSEVLIVVGADRKTSSLDFEAEAKLLKKTLEEKFGARVRILEQPTFSELEAALLNVGGGRNIRHAALYFIGHGGMHRITDTKTIVENHLRIAQGNDGSFWLRGGENGCSLMENDFKNLLKRTIAGRVKNIDLAVSACHSQVWVD